MEKRKDLATEEYFKTGTIGKSLVSLENSNDKLLAITNFGLKPTFHNNLSTPLFETHILNFKKDLYNQKISVELIEFIRNEIKFSI